MSRSSREPCRDAVDRIATSTASRGLTVLVRYAGDNLSATLTSVLDLRPYGVVDLGVFDEEAHRSIRSAGTRVFPEADPIRLVEDPVYLGGRLQARHLLRSRDRQLICALLLDSRGDPYGPVRVRGVADEAAASGSSSPLVVRVPLDAASAARVLSPVFRDVAGPIGVCCYNDEVAAAVVAACQILGRADPRDVGVIGADRTDIGQLLTPRLTTVATDVPGILMLMLQDLISPGPDVSGASNVSNFDFSEFVAVIPGETG